MAWVRDDERADAAAADNNELNRFPKDADVTNDGNL